MYNSYWSKMIARVYQIRQLHVSDSECSLLRNIGMIQLQFVERARCIFVQVLGCWLTLITELIQLRVLVMQRPMADSWGRGWTSSVALSAKASSRSWISLKALAKLNQSEARSAGPWVDCTGVIASSWIYSFHPTFVFQSSPRSQPLMLNAA